MNQREADGRAALDPRHLLAALRAFRRGDLSVRMRDDLAGVDGEIAAAFNELVDAVARGDVAQTMALARQELEEQVEQLSLTSKYKSQFLANVSHELRTPLNSLLILSRQLADNADGNLSEQQLRYADTICLAGTDLMTLLNEILDLAKIESGTMAVDVGPVPFGHLRDYVDQTFRKVAEEKRLAFAVELAPDLPASIETDDMRLRQVLRNLLSNALKFTARGRVRLRVFLAAAEVVGFAVSDTGIGIPRDKQRLIFEAFQQADGSTSREYGGTGLGLAISRELAGLLGGELHVESSAGEGSTFTLFLPTTHRILAARELQRPRALAEPIASEPEVVREAPALASSLLLHRVEADLPERTQRDRRRLAKHDPALAERSVLVVDDDLRNIFALTSLLESYRMRVQYAENGRRALAKLEEDPGIDVVLMDIMMPEMDGYEALRRIRDRPEWKHLPMIALTARAMKGDREKCLEAGASDCIAKPADADQLMSLLRGWLDKP